MAAKKKPLLSMSFLPLADPYASEAWVVRADGECLALGVGTLQRLTGTGSERLELPPFAYDLAVARSGPLLASYVAADVDMAGTTSSFRWHHRGVELDLLAAGYVFGASRLAVVADGSRAITTVTTAGYETHLLVSDGAEVERWDVPTFVTAHFDAADRLFLDTGASAVLVHDRARQVDLASTQGFSRVDDTDGARALVGSRDDRIRLIDLDADRVLFEWNERATKRGKKIPNGARAAFVDDSLVLVASSVGVSLVDTKAGKLVSKSEFVPNVIPASTPTRSGADRWLWGPLLLQMT